MLSPTIPLLMVLELTLTVDAVFTESPVIVSDRDYCNNEIARGKCKRRTERTTKATINVNGNAVPTND